MKTIGITGGIGSGKSHICQIFSQAGIPVFDSDTVAKAQMEQNLQLRESLVNAFGPLTYTPQHLLNRGYLSKMVFSNPGLLRELNSIVHPFVQKTFEEWCLSHRLAGKYPFVIKEAAILLESNTFHGLDLLALVYCPRSVRLHRVKNRSLMEPESIEARMNQQWTDLRKLSKADFIFYNDDFFDVQQQVHYFINYIQSL